MRRLIAAAAATAAITIGSTASPALAWSYKEHIQFTRLAVERILADPTAPDDLKTWLREQTPVLASMDAEKDWFLHESIGSEADPAKLSGLTWWVVQPDVEALDRSAPKKPPFNQPERLNHFIDLDYFNPVDAKKTYQLDGSSLPKLSDIPHDPTNPTFVRAGFLPLAREDAYKNFVAAVKAGKLKPDPATPDDQDHAVRWCAFLCHYTEDNTQPHHATADYKSAQYFKGMQYTPNVHSEMEYRMADDATQPLPELRAEYWPYFEKALAAAKDDVGNKDIFTTTLQTSMDAYKQLPLIGEAAKHALVDTDPKKPTIDTAKFFHYAGTIDGKPESMMEMKAHQTALAVVRAQDVIVQGWKEAKGE